MKKTIPKLLIYIIGLSMCGCVRAQSLPSIKDHDIIYQTSVDKKDAIGFYSSKSNSTESLSSGRPYTLPLIVDDSHLVTIAKNGYPNYPFNKPGSISILSIPTSEEICRTQELRIDNFGLFNRSIVFLEENVLYQLNIENCTSKPILDFSSILEIPDKWYVIECNISLDSKYLIFTLLDNHWVPSIKRLDLENNEVFDFGRNGINPAVSPDNNLVAYYSYDGIHLMTIDGTEDKLIVPDDIRSSDSIITGVYQSPKISWSANGDKLLYHKCILEEGESCLTYGDYSIFIYDLSTAKEEKIIDNGLNPSWISK